MINTKHKLPHHARLAKSIWQMWLRMPEFARSGRVETLRQMG